MKGKRIILVFREQIARQLKVKGEAVPVEAWADP
jgi:hypothetical protein